MNLTDISTIKTLCAAHGFSLSKEFGQNFIVNPGICPKIAEAAGIDEHFGVLEVGPGMGVLTKELARRAKKVVAVEVDKRLPPLLAETLAEYENVTVVEGDVLKVDLAALIRDEFPGLRVAVCANLPYYITSPIVMKLLEERLPIEHITVMVQKEAADRLSAAPGTRAAGAVTYAVHYYAAPRTLFTVQPGSFYPPPKVTSAVIQLRLHEAPPVTPRSAEAMFRVIRAAFSQRRKTAANAASAGLHLPKEAVAEALAARERAGALVTGESLGQVASQTLDNIRATDDAVDLPVFRPLIGTDKLEIIREAERLGSYEISSQDAPDCCTLFMPRSPETHAKLPVVREAGSALPVERWVAELVEAAEVRDYACPAYKPKPRRDAGGAGQGGAEDTARA